MTGYKSKEVIGKSANSFINKEAVSNIIENFFSFKIEKRT